MATAGKKRYETIDIARGIAIVLVVIGHYHTDDMPAYLNVIHDIIYMFHMPLFLFVSGFLCVATWKPDLSYGQFISRKFRRLMVPYLSASVIILLIKLAMQPYMPVDNPVTVLDFVQILYLPAAGYFLWFLWALWWMMCLIPLFKTPKARLLFLVATFLLFPLHSCAPDFFCIRQTFYYMMYFAAGTACYDIYRRHKNPGFTLPTMLSSIVLFAVLAGIALSIPEIPKALEAVVQIILAFSGIAMSMSLSNLWYVIRGKHTPKGIMAVSSASFIIYLFHTTFEGFAKGALSMAHFLDGGNPDIRYGIATLIVVITGTLLPMLAERYLIRPFRFARLLFGLQ